MFAYVLVPTSCKDCGTLIESDGPDDCEPVWLLGEGPWTVAGMAEEIDGVEAAFRMVKTCHFVRGIVFGASGVAGIFEVGPKGFRWTLRSTKG